MNITDVSPAKSTTSITIPGQSVIGRMLSLACSADLQTAVAGSYANIWTTQDAGNTWNQSILPQPPAEQFGVPGAIGGWCVLDIAIFEGWRVERDPRFLADITGKNPAGIVAFGDDGVWTALSDGAGGYEPPVFCVANFGYAAGGWQVDQHPRVLADLTGNGRADIVGFGDAGVWTALSNGDGTFQPPKFVLAGFGTQQAWDSTKHVRLMADIDGDGKADIVGFGDAGVWTALSNGDGTFAAAQFVLADLGADQGWSPAKHVRLMADINGDGKADIVAFGDAGVWTALAATGGGFGPASFVLADLGANQGWDPSKHVRLMADINGDGKADIVAFGDAGVWTALSNGDGSFAPEAFVLANFGANQGWTPSKHVRTMADISGDGKADIVAFGDDGVWTALSNGDGSFAAEHFVIANFGSNQGWDPAKHVRLMADANGDGKADIVAMGDAGVWTALSNGDGSFKPAGFVLASFGYLITALALTRFDREAQDSGIWRSCDGCGTWTRVYSYPRPNGVSQLAPDAGQLARAPGNGHSVYAACGDTFAMSHNAGATFTQAVIPPATSRDRYYHVAVSQPGSDPAVPQAIYVMANSTMFVSPDGGTSWVKDAGVIPAHAGGATGNAYAGSFASSILVVSPISAAQVFTVTSDRNLYSGDYTNTQNSIWTPMVLPPPPTGTSARPFVDSSFLFVTVTQPGQGDLLFLGPGTTNAYVGPFNPASASDWQMLDQEGSVHVDLHGLFLSADFSATIQSGNYQPKSGTVWLLSDGGISTSVDGGKHFQNVPGNISTFSTVNVAGVAVSGKGPALSLNGGDNAGFYSMDGGANWTSIDYDGGDNDCTYADPLRPYSMLVYTPRSGETVTLYETSLGSLPDARSGSANGHAVPGPPLRPLNPDQTRPDSWNMKSNYGLRGSRSIILNMPGDDVSAPGDYVIIRFPSATQARVLRTRNILAIGSANDWDSNPSLVIQQGPDLPDPALSIVQAVGGHAAPVFYVGGNPGNQLYMWTSGMADWKLLVPGKAAGEAIRFFASPYNPNLVYIIDGQTIKRSDDGGATWNVDTNLQVQLTSNNRIPIGRPTQSNLGDQAEVVLTDMQFFPYNTGVRFAVGEAGAFYTADGANWVRLLDTGAFPGRPVNCYYDWISNPNEGALYVAFAGRGLAKISPLPINAQTTASPDISYLVPLLL